MTAEGIEAVFLETHNWGRTARFFQAFKRSGRTRSRIPSIEVAIG